MRLNEAAGLISFYQTINVKNTSNLEVSVFLITRSNTLLSLITNEKPLISATVDVIFLAVIIQYIYIFTNIYKCALNAIEDERWVFFYHTIVSMISLLMIYFLSNYVGLSIRGVYYGLGFNYTILFIGFYLRYYNKIQNRNKIIIGDTVS